MPKRREALIGKRPKGTGEDKDALLREFERKLIGVIRKQKGALSTKAQEEIREIVDEYAKRWG